MTPIPHPNRSDLTDDNGFLSLLKAVNFYKNDLGWTRHELADRLGRSKSTLYEKVKEGKYNKSIISKIASIIAQGYDKKGKGSFSGSKELYSIFNTLLWASSFRTIHGDKLSSPNLPIPSWTEILHNDRGWRLGYTDAEDWIEKGEGGKPKSERGVVSYTLLVSNILGIDIEEWVYKDNWKKLLVGLKEGEYHTIAPFIMRTPSRLEVEYTNKCGSTDGISSLVSTENVSRPLTEMIRESKEDDRNIKEVVDTLTNEKGHRVIFFYVEKEVSHYIAEMMKYINEDLVITREKESMKKISHEMVSENFSGVSIVTTAIETCKSIKTRRYELMVRFDSAEGDPEYEMGKDVAFGCRKGDETLIENLNNAIHIAGNIN